MSVNAWEQHYVMRCQTAAKGAQLIHVGNWSHDTAAEMKKAILASLHRCHSTDEHPQHTYCPSGPDSWCFPFFFQKKRPGKTSVCFWTREERPYTILICFTSTSDPSMRLTAHTVLSRCGRKANQSFHSSV